MSKILARSGVASLGLVTMLAVGALGSPAHAGKNSGTSGTSTTSGTATTSSTDAVTTTDWGDIDPNDAQAALTRFGVWSASRDSGSMYSLTAAQGIQAAWARDVTGKGVTVAVIDTGIAPVDGLDQDNQVVNGPDLSFDGQDASTRYMDEFGHGTHIAGIIAGRDDRWDPKHPDPAIFAGVAPDAKLLNVKVGAGDGGADVSQVIAALDWVTQHRKDYGLNVRVIALAYGTASAQPWQVDPLARAVENAWNAGIVVVAAAGNDGLAAQDLLMPAIDPNVIAVGAVDTNGTGALTDDAVASFSNGGSSTRRPDVVAPGRSIVSLRVPGSYADTMSPRGRVPGDTTGRFFRGSGTSQATAFVAGEVALLVGKNPKLTPDQVKGLLVRTARPLPTGQVEQGAGVPDVLAALAAPTPVMLPKYPASTGLGSLEASRGGAHVVDPNTGAALTGEVDALGAPWDGSTWAARSAAGLAWTQGTWNGKTWSGVKMVGTDWQFAPWTGNTWAGTSWSAWAASSWRGGTWAASSWRDMNWEASSWRASSWRSNSWRSLF